MKNKLGQTFRQGRQADDSDQDTGDAVDGDDLPQAEAFPEKADPAAEQEPPGRRSQKDTSQDEPCRLRMTAVAQVEAEEGEQAGFILRHSVGHLPGGWEVDVPLTYADYYYVEALLRLQKIIGAH